MATPSGATCQMAQPLPPETIDVALRIDRDLSQIGQRLAVVGGIDRSGGDDVERAGVQTEELQPGRDVQHALFAQGDRRRVELVDRHRAGRRAVGDRWWKSGARAARRRSAHAGDAGHGRDHAVGADYPDPVPVDHVEAPVRSDRHVDDVQELRVNGRPAVTRDTLLPVAGDDAKAAVGEADQYLLAVDISHVEGAAGCDGERAGHREVGIGAFGQPGPEVVF